MIKKSSEQIDSESEQLIREISEIKDKIDKLRSDAKDINVTTEMKSVKVLDNRQFGCRRVLKGHFSKVVCVDWFSDSRNVLSASPDGRLLIWDSVTGMKVQAIHLSSLWVTTCSVAPDQSIIASGGLDNICTIHSGKDNSVNKTLTGHNAFISCCKIISNGSQVLTSSGDQTCILWDVDTGKILCNFVGHESDVLDFSLDSQQTIFVTASIDKTTRVWDLRTKKCVRLCEGHRSDVNCVQFFPNDTLFASGAEDGIIKLYDLRSDQYICDYMKSNIKNPVSHLDFSKSGRLLFAGYGDCLCRAWDTLLSTNLLARLRHPGRVSCVRVNKAGTALCTGCWDSNLRIYN